MSDGLLPKVPSPLTPVTLPVLPLDLPRSRNYAQLPFGSTQFIAPCSVDRNDIATQKAGLEKRVIRDIPPAFVPLLHEFSEYVKRWLSANMVPLSTVLDFEGWLESTTYTEGRKTELRRVKSLMHQDLPTRKQCQRVNSFVKHESYPEFKHARWINSRCDAFKVYSGPYFKSIEQEVFKNPHFIKHVPVPDRPALISALKKAGRRYCATDYTSFESHLSPGLMDACETQLYDYMLSNFPEASAVVNTTLCGMNKGGTRRGVRYAVQGRRMSGDMCTSLGNGFTNLMVWSFLHSRKNPHGSWEGYVEGDDGIFSYTGECPTEEEYKRLGLTIKMEFVEDPELASFCGMIYSDGSNIKDPVKFLQTFGWTDKMLNAGTSVKNRLLRSKALSAAYELPNCPIVGAVVRRALQKTRGFSPLLSHDGFHMPHDEFEVPLFEPSEKTRSTFATLFGVDAEAQKKCEQIILSGRDDDLTCLNHTLRFNSDAYLCRTLFIEYT